MTTKSAKTKKHHRSRFARLETLEGRQMMSAAAAYCNELLAAAGHERPQEHGQAALVGAPAHAGAHPNAIETHRAAAGQPLVDPAGAKPLADGAPAVHGAAAARAWSARAEALRPQALAADAVLAGHAGAAAGASHWTARAQDAALVSLAHEPTGHEPIGAFEPARPTDFFYGGNSPSNTWATYGRLRLEVRQTE